VVVRAPPLLPPLCNKQTGVHIYRMLNHGTGRLSCHVNTDLLDQRTVSGVTVSCYEGWPGCGPVDFHGAPATADFSSARKISDGPATPRQRICSADCGASPLQQTISSSQHVHSTNILVTKLVLFFKCRFGLSPAPHPPLLQLYIGLYLLLNSSRALRRSKFTVRLPTWARGQVLPIGNSNLTQR